MEEQKSIAEYTPADFLAIANHELGQIESVLNFVYRNFDNGVGEEISKSLVNITRLAIPEIQQEISSIEEFLKGQY